LLLESSVDELVDVEEGMVVMKADFVRDGKALKE
jgi:hypothetical protein